MTDTSLARTMTEADSLMTEFAWAVHDMQRLARSVSLLVTSLVSNEDFTGPTFYTDIDTLTDPRLGSPTGRKVAEALSDEDRRVLRGLKACREELAYSFFLDFRVEDGAVPRGAAARVAEVRRHIRDGQSILERLLASLSG